VKLQNGDRAIEQASPVECEIRGPAAPAMRILREPLSDHASQKGSQATTLAVVVAQKKGSVAVQDGVRRPCWGPQKAKIYFKGGSKLA